MLDKFNLFSLFALILLLSFWSALVISFVNVKLLPLVKTEGDAGKSEAFLVLCSENIKKILVSHLFLLIMLFV